MSEIKEQRIKVAHDPNVDKVALKKFYDNIEKLTDIVPETLDLNDCSVKRLNTYYILFLPSIKNTDMSIMVRVLGLANNGFFHVVVVDDTEGFMNLYYDAYGKLHKVRFRLYSVNDYDAGLYDIFKVRNINVAFVTSNTYAMEYLFGELDNDKSDEGKKHHHCCRHIHCPMCHKDMPRLIQSYIYRIWYMKPPEDVPDPDKITGGDDTDSYVNSIYSIKISKYLYITYWHIVPTIKLDLSSVLNLFDTIYFDLETSYKDIVFDYYKYGWDQLSTRFIPFTFSRSVCGNFSDDSEIEEANESTILNVFNNYMHLMDEIGKRDTFITKMKNHPDFRSNDDPVHRAIMGYVESKYRFSINCSNIPKISSIDFDRLRSDIEYDDE